MTTIEQVKVITVQDSKFNNDKGEEIHYFKCQGMSHENGVFCFNVYDEEPKVNDVYNMVLGTDSRLKARVLFRKQNDVYSN